MFWDNHTLAVAHSRGRVQLWDVRGYRQRCSAGAVPPAPPMSAFLAPSSSSSFVSAEWVAHDGPITSMAARPTAATSPMFPSPLPPITTTTATSSSPGDPSRIGNGGGGGADHHHHKLGRAGGNEAAAAAAADVVVGVDAHTHLLLSGRPPAVATGGGDGMVRVWTDEGMAAGTYYGARGGASSAPAPAPASGEGTTGHEGAVLCVCWHPRGDLLASAGQDWAIWLWDAEGRALSYIHAHRRWTHTLSFSDDGEFLASYAAGGGNAGWSVGVSAEKQVFTIRWKHPKTLIATHAEVGGRGRERRGKNCFVWLT